MKFKLILLALLIVVLGSSCRNREQTASGGKPSRKKVLTGVRITGIRLLSFPRYSASGEKWDSWAPFREEPDLYIQISQFEQPIYASETREECVPDQPVDFVQSLPLLVTTYTTPLLVQVFDEDGVSSDDNVGYWQFDLMGYKDKKSCQLSNAEGTLKLELSLEWMYE